MGTKFSVYKYFGIYRVLILAVLSMTILSSGIGSVRRDYWRGLINKHYQVVCMGNWHGCVNFK